ncbi:Subtilisin-like protease SBT1.9 [Glycine soja]|uniref:Subtilisin-like protease SBT1.9 n=1 Tax=Glycine soja TaxID=3848 RepID=A0A445F8R4_GLYSO|nr:Subtilisin-like protease SBT1.9 [Glycine soja]
MEPHFVVPLPLMFLITLWLLLSHHANAESSTYIVHMDKSLMPQVFASHHDCAVLSSEELETLKNTHGFVTAYPDRSATIDTTHTFEFLSFNPSNGLWNASNFGEGVIVGMIDTGVRPESESFKDDGMSRNIPSKWKGTCEPGQDFNTSTCNFKLIGARYFNKGVKAANPNITIRMNSARDTRGHGSHTSSTVAGNYVNGASFFGYAKGVARGIAPRARLAMYKVLWDEGGHGSDVLAGMDQAIADGVDVISISLGFDSVPLYEDPVAIAAFAAMEKGVLVSSSAGNAGTILGTLHNGIPWVLTVAAGTIDRTFGSLTLGDGKIIVGCTLFAANSIVEKFPLIYNKTVSACNSVKLLTGVATRGIIICDALDSVSVLTQIASVTAASVYGAVFISEDPELIERRRLFTPSIVISPNDAKSVIKYAKSAQKPFASINFQQTFVGIKPAPAVAIYSSRGPSPSYPGILKPDVMAPGSNVLAAFVPNKPSARIGTNVFLSSDYNFLSGTSMACPHASGVAALLKAAHPDWSAAAIRSALVTTANPLDNTQNPIRDNANLFQYASPLAMGAGEIEPNRALDPGLIYDATPQNYVNLLCALGYTNNQILSITRSRSYECSANPSSDLNYPSFIVLYSNKTRSTVREFRRIVTNVGDGAATYKVKVTQPKGSVVKVSPETLAFGYKNEKQSYSVTVKYTRNKKENISFGDIVWVEDGGARTVRSPIVVAPNELA